MLGSFRNGMSGGCAYFYKFKPTKTSWCAAEVAELAWILQTCFLDFYRARRIPFPVPFNTFATLNVRRRKINSATFDLVAFWQQVEILTSFCLQLFWPHLQYSTCISYESFYISSQAFGRLFTFLNQCSGLIAVLLTFPNVSSQILRCVSASGFNKLLNLRIEAKWTEHDCDSQSSSTYRSKLHF